MVFVATYIKIKEAVKFNQTKYPGRYIFIVNNAHIEIFFEGIKTEAKQK